MATAASESTKERAVNVKFAEELSTQLEKDKGHEISSLEHEKKENDNRMQLLSEEVKKDAPNTDKKTIRREHAQRKEESEKLSQRIAQCLQEKAEVTELKQLAQAQYRMIKDLEEHGCIISDSQTKDAAKELATSYKDFKLHRVPVKEPEALPAPPPEPANESEALVLFGPDTSPEEALQLCPKPLQAYFQKMVQQTARQMLLDHLYRRKNGSEASDIGDTESDWENVSNTRAASSAPGISEGMAGQEHLTGPQQ